MDISKLATTIFFFDQYRTIILELVFAEMDGESCSSGKFKLYEQLELQEFQDKFVIKSVEAPDQGFSIDRRDGTIEPLNGINFLALLMEFQFCLIFLKLCACCLLL